jgi:hypothetical protein
VSVAAAFAIVLAVVPTPAADSLVVTSVDASAYPQVVVDFVLPERFAAVEVTPAMVAVDGAPAAAVVAVDPTDVVVSLVVDDGPAVPAEVVGASQGGAIELVRTIEAGTRIAVGTPSGLQTAFTADPSATIARISGIIAGAPAVTSLPQLILDAAAALGTTETSDRHLVVVLGGPSGASEQQLSQLAILVASNGITLHLVSAAGAVEPALVSIAEQSGGSVPIAGGTLASFDAITAAISDRYRITTTVSAPGQHLLALTINGETVQAVVTVPPPTPAVSTPTTTPEVASSPPVPTAPTGADKEVPNDVEATTPTTVEAVAGTDATTPPDDNTLLLTISAIALMVVLLAVASGYRMLRRRRGREPHVDADRLRPTSVGGRPAAGTDEAEPAASAVAEPVEPPGAQSHPVESEAMREAIADVTPDPESSPTTELETWPDPEPVAEFVSHEAEPEPEPMPAPESEREPEHQPQPAPEPEPEPIFATVADPMAAPEPRRRKAPVSFSSVVAALRTARSTPAQRTRGEGRSEPEPAHVPAEPRAEPEWLVSGFLRFCPASGEVWAGRIQVHLDPQELAILELLMTSGSRGVTQDEIIRAGNLDPAGRDFAPMLARIKGKTGTRGQMVRRESVTVYIFDDDVEIGDEKSVGRRRARTPARR